MEKRPFLNLENCSSTTVLCKRSIFERTDRVTSQQRGEPHQPPAAKTSGKMSKKLKTQQTLEQQRAERKAVHATKKMSFLFLFSIHSQTFLLPHNRY